MKIFNLNIVNHFSYHKFTMYLIFIIFFLWKIIYFNLQKKSQTEND